MPMGAEGGSISHCFPGTQAPGERAMQSRCSDQAVTILTLEQYSFVRQLNVTTESQVRLDFTMDHPPSTIL